jgi:hypothetical protein
MSQWFGFLAPQTWFALQLPQSSIPPQPLLTVPQLAASLSQV